MHLCRASHALTCSIILITLSLYAILYSTPGTGAPRVSNINSEIKSEFADNAINNTLVIVPINLGMVKWVDNLLCSLTQTSFDTKRIVFWALDSEVKALLDVRGYVVYSVTTDGNLHDKSSDFKRMMRERPKFFIDILSTGFDVLVVDADTIFFDNPLAIRDPAVDMVFSSDSREFFNTPMKDPFKDVWREGSRIPPVCNGMLWMKSNANTLKIWHDMLDVFESGPRLALYRTIVFKDDQRGMNVLLNDGRAKLVEPLPYGITADMLKGRANKKATLDVRLLDQASAVSGHLLKHRTKMYEQNLANLELEGGKRLAIHFNWDPTELDKEEVAKELGLWQLTKEGRCVHDVKERAILS